MPAENHPGEIRNLTANKQSKCLKYLHNCREAGSIISQAEVARAPMHNPRKNCRCNPCKSNRSKGCSNPHKCYLKAQEILTNINAKWDPTSPEAEPIPPTSLHQIPPMATTTGDPTNTIRIFGQNWAGTQRGIK
jgi:hypothetical protein